MFTDRIDAGDQLARRLAGFKSRQPVVVGLPRGGVPVAARVALALDAPLDVILVRKLGLPFQPELAMGAIGEGGVRVVNDEVVDLAAVTPAELDEVAAVEAVELERRSRRYRGGRPSVPLAGRVVLVVDDGIATGSTARAACQVARAHGAAWVVLAVPVAPPGWTARLAGVADELVALHTPPRFRGVGQFYLDFAATTDEDVVRCLDAAAARVAGSAGGRVAAGSDAAHHREVLDPAVVIEVGGVSLHGHLAVPADASGLVIFAHGAGSSRHSPRNRFVASVLNEAGLATLLFDLLTESEELDRSNVFDIALLGRRLAGATAWAAGQDLLRGLPIGFFGASTGAAAALWAASEPGCPAAAVVSRGGRPDLAGPRLPRVRVPTLLIVGGRDTAVLELNRQAAAQLGGEVRLDVIPGATHLFEEPGTLAAAASRARDWFAGHLHPATGDAGRIGPGRP